jgi:hypothetical protein
MVVSWHVASKGTMFNVVSVILTIVGTSLGHYSHTTLTYLLGSYLFLARTSRHNSPNISDCRTIHTPGSRDSIHTSPLPVRFDALWRRLSEHFILALWCLYTNPRIGLISARIMQTSSRQPRKWTLAEDQKLREEVEAQGESIMK